MAPKKGKGKKGGDDAGGKVKDPAPTEVEREELRLKIHILAAKLQELHRRAALAGDDQGLLRVRAEHGVLLGLARRVRQVAAR